MYSHTATDQSGLSCTVPKNCLGLFTLFAKRKGQEGSLQIGVINIKSVRPELGLPPAKSFN